MVTFVMVVLFAVWVIMVSWVLGLVLRYGFDVKPLSQKSSVKLVVLVLVGVNIIGLPLFICWEFLR